MLIEVMNRLARKLVWLRPVMLIIVVVLAGLLGYSLLVTAAEDSDNALILYVLGIAWALLFHVFLVAFRQVPAGPPAGESWLRRVQYRARRLLYGLLALVIIGLTAAVAILTLKLLGVWLR